MHSRDTLPPLPSGERGTGGGKGKTFSLSTGVRVRYGAGACARLVPPWTEVAPSNAPVYRAPPYSAGGTASTEVRGEHKRKSNKGKGGEGACIPLPLFFFCVIWRGEATGATGDRYPKKGGVRRPLLGRHRPKRRYSRFTGGQRVTAFLPCPPVK